ncbi:hypothetical protein ACVIGB_001052 [Bradyrhizobium sp. USDA 4341]
MRAQVGIRTSLVAISVFAVMLSSPARAIDGSQPPASGNPGDWTTANDPSPANWPMQAVQTLPPDVSPALPNASAFAKGVYIDYSWAFPTHGTGDAGFVYTMKQPFIDANFDGTIPPTTDGAALNILSSDYSVNCSGLLAGTVYAGGGGSPQYVCTINNAPAFDARTLMDALASMGWNFTIVFPMTDPGFGKALIFWSSDPMDATYGQLPQHQGFARVYNVNWQDQFPSTDVSLCDYQGPTCQPNGKTYTFAHADAVGDYIASLNSSLRETTFRGYQMIATAIPDPKADIPTTAYPYAVIVTDSWINAPVQPPVEPAPIVANGAKPEDLNIASTGNGGGVGRAGAGVVSTASGVVPFDTVAFCSAPGKNGQPRSQTWINACIAATPH